MAESMASLSLYSYPDMLVLMATPSLVLVMWTLDHAYSSYLS
jgi:hypothetical protein